MNVRPIYIEKILPFIDKPVIKVLTGIRRSGKSTLLKLIQKKLRNDGVQDEQIHYINKDSLQFEHIRTYSELYSEIQNRLVGGKKNYLFIDEIQEIEEWEKAISSFYADGVADIYITGSNADLLSSELASYLTGRYVEIRIQTLVFSEFLEFRGDKKGAIEDEFQLFLKYGGFPGLHYLDFEEGVMKQYLEAILNTVILKDVVSRNSVRDVPLLERLLRFVADNHGNVTTAANITKFLKSQHIKSSVDTIQNYLHWIQVALALIKVGRYDIRGKSHLELYEKYYLADIGMLFAILGDRFTDISGKLEALVLLELQSRGYSVSVGKVNKLEVDFIAEKDGHKKYFQVSYLLADETIVEREFGVYSKIQDDYPKYVLSLDKGLSSDRNGVRWLNMIDFLLQRDI